MKTIRKRDKSWKDVIRYQRRSRYRRILCDAKQLYQQKLTKKNNMNKPIWAIDANEYNPPVNLSLVESFDPGIVEPSIVFKFPNNGPIKWLFSDNKQMQDTYKDLLEQIKS